MIRSKIIENHSLIAEGVLDASSQILTMDIEGMGEVTLQKILQGFDGKEVRLTVRLSEEIKKEFDKEKSLEEHTLQEKKEE